MLGLKTLDEVKKPDNVSDEDFKKQKQQPTILFNYTAANAAINAKDYASAVQSFKAVLALDPDDLSTNYNLGRAYLAMTPPQPMAAFWYDANAVTCRKAMQAQADEVKKYLKGLIANHQGGNVCDSLTDGELNELLQLAGSSADRPSTYSLPSAADISAAQKEMTLASVFNDLKAGGDKSKLTWLAACGLEFPEVPGKVIEVAHGDPIVLKIAFVTSDAEFDAATTPNMDVKVVGQPEAARVEKDSAVHFTGTLVSYDPDPTFFLHWDKAKVNAQHLGRAGLVAVRAIQNALDEALFEFADRLFKKNSTLYHLTDESFQFVFHVGTLRSRTSCVQGSATNRARVLPGCETPPGTWRVWRRRPREEAPGRAGFSASEFARDSRAQTVCRKKVEDRRDCILRRAKSGKNPASGLRRSTGVDYSGGRIQISCRRG